MTNEQREAIEYLKESVVIYKNTIPKISKAIETVLNMLKEKDKEIEKLKADNKKAWKLNANMTQRHLSDIFKIKKKDKQIELMAKYWNTGLAMCDNCDKIVEKYEKNNCQDCIKKYFADLVEKGVEYGRY